MRSSQPYVFNVLLADDDADERYFFEEAIKELPVATNFKTVNDGVYLMALLNQHSWILPDIIFLDINMPRKNGLECLAEIRRNERLKLIPIVVYSICGNEENISAYYRHGASSFLQKGKYAELIKYIDGLRFVSNTMA